MKTQNIISLNRNAASALTPEDSISDQNSNYLTEPDYASQRTVASRCNATVTTLHDDWNELLADLGYVGRLRICTIGTYTRFECTAGYRSMRASNKPDDTTINTKPVNGTASITPAMENWTGCYAVREKTRHGVRHRIRIFGSNSVELHSVTLLPDSDHDAWQALLDMYGYPLSHQPGIETNITNKAHKVDIHSLPAKSMPDDTPSEQLLPFHGFNSMVSASCISPDAVVQLLSYLACNNMPVLVSAGNDGVAQECHAEFDRLYAGSNTIRLKSTEYLLDVAAPRGSSWWIISGLLHDEPRNSIELHSATGELLVRLSTTTEYFEWNNLLYMAAKDV
jgi:putative hemin transport protein